MTSSNDKRIVRCFGCESQVRVFATRMEPTGEFGDEERWCLACLEGINDYSASLIPNKQEALESAMRNVLMDEGDLE